MSTLAVFDTNIFVSHFLTPSRAGAVNTAVSWITNGKVTPVYSDAMMAEYREVLGRKKFHFQEDVVFSFLGLIIQIGKHVFPASDYVGCYEF